jgi:transposase
MAMGKREREQQSNFWVATSALPAAASHPFYERVNQILAARRFDDFVESECRKFYHERLGRPSLPPAVYFRLMLIGYFEGLDSERGIAWRMADSLGLRRFLGYALTDTTPDHSTISRTRRLIDVETHEAIFGWVLGVLADSDLLKGKTLGLDATTLEANAALKSIVRRDTGESYQQFLTGLAQQSGIATPTREELAKLDRKRKKKTSNDDWQNPHDPDAKVTKMKDGRTHLAHKAEHAVDLDTGAIVAVTIQPADRGDTTSMTETIATAADNLVSVITSGAGEGKISEAVVSELVADKGYHSNAALLAHDDLRTYISEPDRGRRNWAGKRAERDAVYANRRRIRSRRGRRLMRQRGELIERSFAHCYDTGGMRRTHLRGHDNIFKRVLLHVAGFNLSLVMRKLLGAGTPRGLSGLAARILGNLQHGWALYQLTQALRALLAPINARTALTRRCAA